MPYTPLILQTGIPLKISPYSQYQLIIGSAGASISFIPRDSDIAYSQTYLANQTLEVYGRMIKSITLDSGFAYYSPGVIIRSPFNVAKQSISVDSWNVGTLNVAGSLDIGTVSEITAGSITVVGESSTYLQTYQKTAGINAIARGGSGYIKMTAPAGYRWEVYEIYASAYWIGPTAVRAAIIRNWVGQFSYRKLDTGANITDGNDNLHMMMNGDNAANMVASTDESGVTTKEYFQLMKPFVIDNSQEIWFWIQNNTTGSGSDNFNMALYIGGVQYPL